MFPFFESIAILDGNARNLFYHQDRVNRTFKKFYPQSEPHHLEYLLHKTSLIDAPIVKIKFSYREDGYKIHQLPYSARIFKRFYLVTDNQIEYAYKYSDRKFLERHTGRLTPDEQILLIREGLITDSSFSNVIFYDGYRWLTPAKPLLEGTMRASLIADWKIHEEELIPGQLHLFKSFKLINAMLTLEESPEYPIDLIQTIQ